MRPRFASGRSSVGLDSSINLIVATLDLQLVRLLRQSMAGAPTLDGGGARRHIHPQPTIEPRPVHEPAPRIEPRKTIEPTPRFAPRPTVFVDVPPSSVPATTPPVVCETSQTEKTVSPLQPPWKTVPWEQPIPPAPKVKVVQYRPDIISKGSLIDFFI